MKRQHLLLACSAAALVAFAACASGTPTSPSSASPPVSAAATATAPPVSAPVALSTCATWASTQRASGVATATGAVASQRQAFYSAGGGVRMVGNKYFAAWFPSTWSSSSPRRVMVGLHGTGGAPETEWSTDWKDIVSARGWAYVGLKYVDDATGVHDEDTAIYANLKAMLDDLRQSCDFASPSLFLVGFSRGSAQTFPVAYLDLKDRRFFKAMGSNSGSWTPGMPMVPTMEAIVARGEVSAYSGARFWMYCGALDFQQGFAMCDGMRAARTFITSYAGTVERLYEDPTGGHGGLAKNADAWGAMFSYFEGLR